MTTARRRQRSSNTETESNRDSAVTGYEAELWRMADTLRGSMDAAEYKHVVLGLIFLKYISDAFERPTPSLRKRSSTARTPKIQTSIAPRASSGCRPKPDGSISKIRPDSPPLADWWTTP